MAKKSGKSPSAGRIRVNLPPQLNATYSNLALITHSRSEFIIDYAQILPQVAQAKVMARVVMTAFNTKLLLRALTEQVARFEAEHGEIELPEGTSLADQLFKDIPPDSPDSKPTKEE
jgi:hypothetical protein